MEDKAKKPIEFTRPTLYRPYSIEELQVDGRLYHGIRIHWAVLHRRKPLVCIDNLFGTKAHMLGEHEYHGTQAYVDEMFTSEEAGLLNSYLERRGMSCTLEPAELPTDGFSYEPDDLADGWDRWNTFEEDGYDLPFDAGGYFNKRGLDPVPGIYYLSHIQRESGTKFLREVIGLIPVAGLHDDDFLRGVLQRLFDMGYWVQKGPSTAEKTLDEIKENKRHFTKEMQEQFRW